MTQDNIASGNPKVPFNPRSMEEFFRAIFDRDLSAIRVRIVGGAVAETTTSTTTTTSSSTTTSTTTT